MVDILQYIPVGHKNAVSREYLSSVTGYSDRKVRELIEKACTREHPILNMQDGKGYFRPAENEMHLVRLYRAQENRRTLKIRNKVTELDKYIKVTDEANSELTRNQMNLSDLPGWQGGD